MPELLENLGKPRILARNKNIPYEFKYGTGALLGFQEAYKLLDESYSQPVAWNVNPKNPALNGGIEIKTSSLDSPKVSNSNNYSLVAIYKYRSVLVVFPGDIEDSGWQQLQEIAGSDWSELVRQSGLRFLVAPHHGRASGYSEAMMNFFSPHACIICDGYGKGETDNRFRTKPLGFKRGEVETKYLTTKTSGRVLIRVSENGKIFIHQIERQ